MSHLQTFEIDKQWQTELPKHMIRGYRRPEGNLPPIPTPVNQILRNVGKVPIVGPWVGRIGRAWRILSHPCNPTPEMWFWAGFHAIPHVIWTLFSPSPTDFLAEKFANHWCRIGRGGKFFVAVPDKVPKVTPQNGLDGHVLRGIQLLRRVGWYLTVADATTGLVVNWTSFAYQYAGCRFPGSIYAESRLNAPQIFINGNAGDYDITTWIPQAQHGMIAGARDILVPGGVPSSCRMSITAEPAFVGSFDPCNEWSFSIVEQTGNSTFASSSGVTGAEGPQTLTAWGISDGMHIPPNGYLVRLHKGPGFLKFNSGFFSASGDSKLHGLHPYVSPHNAAFYATRQEYLGF